MAGTNETGYYLKHGNNLNPLVAKKSDLEDQYIPKWDDTEQRLTESVISESYDSVAQESTIDIQANTEITGDISATGDGEILGDTHIGGDTQLDGDVVIGTPASGGEPAVEADLTVIGNITQNGASLQTHLEQIYTTKDHIILRDGVSTALLSGECSGLKVTKPDGTYDVHLCVKNDNYAYVGETDANGDPLTVTGNYEFVDHDLYQDEDPDSPTYGDYFDDIALTIPHEFYIPSGATNVTYTDVTQVGDVKKSVQINYTLSESSIQRLLTVDSNVEDQSLMYYDNNFKEAKTIEVPANPTAPLVPVLDGGRVTYREYKAGGEGEGDANNWVGTLAEYEDAELVVDPDDPEYLKDKSGVDIYGLTAADLDIATEVREGDNQPVTSGAVYNALGNIVRLPDWESAVTISVAQVQAGYTAPSNGMLVGNLVTGNTTSGRCELDINGVWVAGTNTIRDQSVAISIPVSEGDRLTFIGVDGWTSNLTSHISFVSFKQIGE